MATVDWPLGHAFEPREFVVGASVPKSAFAGFFTGSSQSVSHLADRLRISITLLPCSPDEGALREAFITELVSAGHWVRLWHMIRSVPRGTLRGSPTISANAAAGARSVEISTTPGATLLGGDMLGAAGQLLPVGYAGAVADGGGNIIVPLQIPLRLPVSIGQAVTWAAPTGTFQLALDQVDVSYARGRWQQPVQLPFREVP